jgi:hypothetical protein
MMLRTATYGSAVIEYSLSSPRGDPSRSRFCQMVQLRSRRHRMPFRAKLMSE